jgi:Leucine-rich repeat (LRR) protein
LSSLPSSFSELKELKILSLRDNKFITFPNVIIGCSSLSCIDMGENQLTELPKSLIKLKLLKSLQLDGNPMSVPSREICDKGVEYIIPELEKLCSNSDDEYDNNTNNTNSDIQTGSHYDEKYDSDDSDDNKVYFLLL